MARRQVVVSDLTGAIIENPSEVAEVRILQHPHMDHQVKLDAFVLEVANLEGSKRELVTIELVLPNTPPETMIVELKEFEKLIKAGKPDDVLNGAERYYGSRAAATDAPRRGRPKGSTNASAPSKGKRDPAQLNSIREWARANGHEVSDRGRIAGSIEAAYEEAHTS